MRHWVLVETGANQSYIFDTNRMRHVVGASELVARSTTTALDEAVAGLSGVAVVQRLSGKALLVVDEASVGREIIGSLSRRVLDRSPGLLLTGVVGPPFDPDLTYSRNRPLGRSGSLDHVRALRLTFDEAARCRQVRPSLALRDPLVPWHEICPDSGLAAAGSERRGDRDVLVSAPVLAKSDAARPARARMVEELGPDLDELVPKDLDDLAHDGWLAVVHADGNGVGSLFQGFADLVLRATGGGELDEETHRAWLSAVTRELESATTRALRAALGEVARDETLDPRGCVLPVVVGGDDVTVVCHGGLALPVVRRFLRHFATETRATEHLSRLAAMQHRPDGAPPAASGARGVTASAGIAVVKPHHPFSRAYALAEGLCQSAKGVKQYASTSAASSFDVHVLFEASHGALREQRPPLTPDTNDPDDPDAADDTRRPVVRRTGAPYLVPVDDSDTGAPEAGQTGAEQSWLAAHDEDHLGQVIDLLRQRRLSASHAHQLREAADLGIEEYEHALRVVASREPLSVEAQELLSVRDDGTGSAFVLLPDAMLVRDLEIPRHRRPDPDDTTEPPTPEEDQTSGATPDAGHAVPAAAMGTTA